MYKHREATTIKYCRGGYHKLFYNNVDGYYLKSDGEHIFNIDAEYKYNHNLFIYMHVLEYHGVNFGEIANIEDWVGDLNYGYSNLYKFMSEVEYNKTLEVYDCQLENVDDLEDLIK